MHGHVSHLTASPQPRLVPLLRRDSIGDSHHILTFSFDPPLSAQPGQFLMIRGADWGLSPFLPRPMSLMRAGSRVSVLVKVVGEGTQLLAHAQPGQMYSLLAPLGQGWGPCSSEQTAVLVAGGVGVCPLLFLAEQLLEQKRKVIVLYGARTASDLVLREELEHLTDLRVATQDGSAGDQALITQLLPEVLSGCQGKAKVFACGPMPMMSRVVQLAKEAEVPCEVSLETAMGCGFGVCLGCAVPLRKGGYLYACSEGPCVNGYDLAWEG